jgi:hypothetical protein
MNIALIAYSTKLCQIIKEQDTLSNILSQSMLNKAKLRITKGSHLDSDKCRMSPQQVHGL